MGKKIYDGFTGTLKRDGTPMSRQQIYSLRKKLEGRCIVCGEIAVGIYCKQHTLMARERQRKNFGAIRRNKKKDEV